MGRMAIFGADMLGRDMRSSDDGDSIAVWKWWLDISARHRILDLFLSMWITSVGGAEVKSEHGVGRDTLEVWACSKRRGVRTSQVSAVRKVGPTSAVAVSLAGPDVDIAASVIVMRTQIGCRMCAMHR